MTTHREEDYLEAILSLVKGKGFARVGELAKRFDCSSATVTEMLDRLSTKQLVNYEKYVREVTLTERGRSIAEEVDRRHRIIKEFLIILGVEERTADEDACSMEHILHEDTLDRLEKLIEFVDCFPGDPCWLTKYREYIITGRVDRDDCMRES